MKVKQQEVSLKGKDGFSATVSLEKAKQLKKKCRALLHPLRLEIIQMISNSEEITVGAIYGRLKIEQSVCSVMLGELREAKFVIARKAGKQVFYSVNGRELKRFSTMLNKFTKAN